MKTPSELYSNSQEAKIKFRLAELAVIQAKKRADEEAEADEMKRKRNICESERQFEMARLEAELRDEVTTGGLLSQLNMVECMVKQAVETPRLEDTATDGRVESFRGIQVSDMDGYPMLYDPNNEVYPGKMYIMTFANSKGCDPLPGIDADVAAVTQSFKQMKFDVSSPIEKDLTKDDLKKKLKAIARANFSKYSSLICMFNGHGSEDSIVVRDGAFKVDDIFDIFHRCQHESLVDKPKIFIFEACRGTKDDELVEGALYRKAQPDYMLNGLSPTAPRAADYLICYAATKGYGSFVGGNGSLYNKELTEILNEHFQGKYEQKVDLLQLLTKVSAKVANKSVKRTVDQKSVKQMPCFVSSLRKQLYLPTTFDIGCT